MGEVVSCGFRLGRSESKQYFSARGSKSRNKVAVGEPAAGSFPKSALKVLHSCGSSQTDNGHLSRQKEIPKQT